ncbi:uncharacterized protein LOC130451618 [Diorhabda sublineata]|uniref:uncharacterized protein LOC130451618 n=1 Tax=Diorhabda sublineata TaxID=1163346 RepID=UPI0024E18D38|nr:uncharacterized protein LOC130451618 [Diorhabda sublineata]
MSFKEISVDEVYQRDKNIKKEDVQSLSEWVSKQPHLPKITELQLILFLHSCNNSIETAKNVIDIHFCMKTACRDIFGSRTMHDKVFQEGLNYYLCYPFSTLTQTGDMIIYSKLSNPDPSIYSVACHMKVLDVAIFLHLHQYGPPNGLQIIVDMEGITLGHLLKANPIVIKKVSYYFQEALPVKLKHVHFINVVNFIDKIFAVIKPLLSKELFNLFTIHADMDSIYKFIPKEILPEELGGNEESIPKLQENLKNRIKTGEKLLKFQEEQLVDESKRKGPSKYNENLFGVDGSFKKLEIDITDFFIKMSDKEINVEEIYEKDSKLKRKDVESLLDWIEKQPHLPHITELQAILFLHSCDYRNEAAKTTIDTYFTVKTLCYDMFNPRTLKNSLLLESLNCTLVAVLPQLAPSGDTVMLTKILNSDPAKYNLKEQCKYFDVVTMLYLHQYGPVNGLQIICDMNQSTIGHVLKINPVIAKKFLFYLQEALPVRIKYIHIINVASFVDKLLAIIKPFMKKELLDALLLHTDMETFYKYVPKEILPVDYGGCCQNVQKLRNDLENNMAECEDLLKFQENQQVDESKRQGPMKNEANMFGIQGSFKKLEVD